MRKLIAGLTVGLALGLVVSVHGQDLNTLLAYFIQDMRNGTLGTTVTFTSLGLASGGAGTAKDTTLTATAAGKISLTGTTPMIQIGGTTSSFAALKGSGSLLALRTADDSANANLQLGQLTLGASMITPTNVLISTTAPTVSSGFGTSPTIPNNNGTATFTVNVGTGGIATSGVLGLPAATTGWNCQATDITTNSATVFITKQTASTTTTATIGNFNTSAVAAAWAASDILRVSCFGY